MIRVMGLKVNLHRMHPFRSTNDPMGRMITVLKGGAFHSGFHRRELTSVMNRFTVQGLAMNTAAGGRS